MPAALGSKAIHFADGISQGRRELSWVPFHELTQCLAPHTICHTLQGCHGVVDGANRIWISPAR
jgi:hypothetical protein